MTMQTIVLDEEEKACKLVNPLILRSFIKAKRAIAVTGAGISVPSGIPDFRSLDGYYKRADGVEGTCKGKDLFDAQVLRSTESFSAFLKFIAEMKDLCDDAVPSQGHQFLDFLCEKGRLLRCYTQNIDCLESRLPFKSPRKTKHDMVVNLHGRLDMVICTDCNVQSPCQESFMESFRAGEITDCPSCKTISDNRVANGKRSKKIGKLRPDIVLYNESHPSGDEISVMVERDLAKKPDLLVVIGTSLKVSGIKTLVKKAAKAVRQTEGGLVILVNKTPLTAVSEWKNIFDYELIGCADNILGSIRQSMELHLSLGKKQQWTSPVFHSPSQSSIKDFFRNTNSLPGTPVKAAKQRRIKTLVKGSEDASGEKENISVTLNPKA